MNILVVRACAVGDFVLNLPALRALQEDLRPEFTLVGYPRTLELAREFIRVRNVHSIDVEPWRRLFHEPVAGLAFDRAIVWMREEAVAANLRLSGVTDVLRADPFPGTGHAAAHLVSTLGLRAPDLPDRWQPRTPHVVLHPGSGSAKKRWPCFLELAERLESVQFVIGPAEAEFDTGRFRRLEGLPLADVAEVVRGARAFVGNDSGLTHLAGYLGCPTVALFGPTDPRMWGPLGRRVCVLHEPDLAAIAVADVLAGLREVGRAAPGSRPGRPGPPVRAPGAS